VVAEVVSALSRLISIIMESGGSGEGQNICLELGDRGLCHLV
jgi:hypothetical protein